MGNDLNINDILCQRGGWLNSRPYYKKLCHHLIWRSLSNSYKLVPISQVQVSKFDSFVCPIDNIVLPESSIGKQSSLSLLLLLYNIALLFWPPELQSFIVHRPVSARVYAQRHRIAKARPCTLRIHRKSLLPSYSVHCSTNWYRLRLRKCREAQCAIAGNSRVYGFDRRI